MVPRRLASTLPPTLMPTSTGLGCSSGSGRLISIKASMHPMSVQEGTAPPLFTRKSSARCDELVCHFSRPKEPAAMIVSSCTSPAFEPSTPTPPQSSPSAFPS